MNKEINRLLKVCAVLLAVFSSAALPAQSFKNLQVPQSPLILEAQGSFYIGGEKSRQTFEELGNFTPAGSITINQMYVKYMVPQQSKSRPSVVMVHGMTLTGKCWETTPDGRMGWDEYFVRKGYAVYVPDQVGRGRSGFNQAVYNNVRNKRTNPDTLPPMRRFSDEHNWTNFRFGPKENVPNDDNQFPLEALHELSKQSVPDVSGVLPNPNPNYAALAELAGHLKNTIIISHSQSGSFPLSAALINRDDISGMIIIEPGFLPNFNDEEIRALAKIPMLIVYGDHLDDNPADGPHYWQTTFETYSAFSRKINNAGGKSRVLYLPDAGFNGNSHMLMQDRNHLQVADLLLEWIDTLKK